MSLAGAGRDPASFPDPGRDLAFFPDPGRFDVRRANAWHNLAFRRRARIPASGPIWAEARSRLALWRGGPGLRLDPAHRASPRGVVFRNPPAPHVARDLP